jgi:hypothetical protein
MFAVGVQANGQQNQSSLDVVARVSGIAPAKARMIIRHPHLAACFRIEF